MSANGRMWLFAATSVAVIAAHAAAETYVIPVVVPGVAGKNGSYWETEVRVIRLSAIDAVAVRRSWVALPGGGFADDPATAPSWTIQGSNEPPKLVDMLILTGEQLLSGVSTTHAAVGLEVEGQALVQWRSANSQGQARLPNDGPSEEGCCWPGSGQFATALTTPLRGGGTIPWLTSGKGVFRTNLGLINPGPEAARLRVRVYGLGPAGDLPDPPNTYWSITWWSESYEVRLPAWGWRQIDDVFSTFLAPCRFDPCPERRLLTVNPAFVSISPVTDGEYFAYASVLYSPRNDPEFVPAVNVTVEGLAPWPE